MKRRQSGFTLVELMVVVAIVAALATVAMLSFRRYVIHARVSEAYTMLGEIRIREEQYKAEFGQYAPAPFHPGAVPGENGADWGAPPPAWTQIGARPDGFTHFRYEVLAGNPGEDPGVPWPTVPANDFWFVAHAEADLDSDGILSQFETYSVARHVWVNPGIGGYEYEAQ